MSVRVNQYYQFGQQCMSSSLPPMERLPQVSSLVHEYLTKELFQNNVACPSLQGHDYDSLGCASQNGCLLTCYDDYVKKAVANEPPNYGEIFVAWAGAALGVALLSVSIWGSTVTSSYSNLIGLEIVGAGCALVIAGFFVPLALVVTYGKGKREQPDGPKAKLSTLYPEAQKYVQGLARYFQEHGKMLEGHILTQVQ